MLLKCIKKLGKQVSANDRADLEDSYNQHIESGLSEHAASAAALTDYHKVLFDATNAMRQAARVKPLPYQRYERPVREEIPPAKVEPSVQPEPSGGTKWNQGDVVTFNGLEGTIKDSYTDKYGESVVVDTANGEKVWPADKIKTTPPASVESSASSEVSGKSAIPLLSPYSGTPIKEGQTYTAKQTKVANAWRQPQTDYVRGESVSGLGSEIARKNAIQDHVVSVKFAIKQDFYNKAIEAGELTREQAITAIKSIGKNLPQFVQRYLETLPSSSAQTKSSGTSNNVFRGDFDVEPIETFKNKDTRIVKLTRPVKAELNEAWRQWKNAPFNPYIEGQNTREAYDETNRRGRFFSNSK